MYGENKLIEHIPKYTRYVSDGRGRDSYILTNNGGLTKDITKFGQKIYVSQNVSSKAYV